MERLYTTPPRRYIVEGLSWRHFRGGSEGAPRTGLVHPWARWDRGPVAGKKIVSLSRDPPALPRPHFHQESIQLSRISIKSPLFSWMSIRILLCLWISIRNALFSQMSIRNQFFSRMSIMSPLFLADAHQESIICRRFPPRVRCFRICSS